MELPKSAGKPPGRKLIKRLSTRTKWILLSIAGLFLTLYGLSVLVNANALRLKGVETGQWVLLGLYSYLILAGGLLILGQAFRFRLLLDYRSETRKEIKRLKKKIDSIRMNNLKSAQKRQEKAKSPTK